MAAVVAAAVGPAVAAAVGPAVAAAMQPFLNTLAKTHNRMAFLQASLYSLALFSASTYDRSIPI